MADSKTLSMYLTNNGGSSAVISGISVGWFLSSGQKLLEINLDADRITNVDDNGPPSTVPSEFPFSGPVGYRTIPAFNTRTLTITFLLDLEPSGYDVTISFGSGCQVQGSR